MGFITTSVKIANLNKSGLDRPDVWIDTGARFTMLPFQSLEHFASGQLKHTLSIADAGIVERMAPMCYLETGKARG